MANRLDDNMLLSKPIDLDEIEDDLILRGGPGSGNFGHSGLPGVWGGSRPRGAGDGVGGGVAVAERPDMAAIISDAASAIGQRIKDQDFETSAFVVGGKEYYSKDGGAYEVRIKNSVFGEIRRLGYDPNNYIEMVHNHPMPVLTPPSPSDMQAMYAADADAFYLYTPQGKALMIRRTQKPYDYEEFWKEYRFHYDQFDKDNQQKILDRFPQVEDWTQDIEMEAVRIDPEYREFSKQYVWDRFQYTMGKMSEVLEWELIDV